MGDWDWGKNIKLIGHTVLCGKSHTRFKFLEGRLKEIICITNLRFPPVRSAVEFAFDFDLVPIYNIYCCNFISMTHDKNGSNDNGTRSKSHI